jgi:hypothetical protein
VTDYITNRKRKVLPLKCSFLLRTGRLQNDFLIKKHPTSGQETLIILNLYFPPEYFQQWAHAVTAKRPAESNHTSPQFAIM